MKGIVITATCATLVLACTACTACKDKHSNIQNLPASITEHDYRYYAFKLKAYRDQQRLRKERLLANNRWQDIDLRVAVKFSPGSNDINKRRDNPFIAVRNMENPADCYQVESLYDPDADPPIYVKGKANANYRKRLDFHAISPSGHKSEGKLFTLLWFWGAKYTDYGIMKRFQIKQTRADKHSIFFLQEEPIKLSPNEIKQNFFNPITDKTCEQAVAQKNINNSPIQGTYHHTFVLKKFKGAGKNKKLLDEDMKIALRLDLSPTKGGSQYAQVIVKDMDKPSSCYAFSKHAKTIDWQAYNGKHYTKHIEIAKKFGDSDRYYMITWLLDKEKNAQIGYFYLDERAGGPYYEYIHPDNNTPLSVPTPTAIAAKYFPSSDPAAGCATPKPKQH